MAARILLICVLSLGIGCGRQIETGTTPPAATVYEPADPGESIDEVQQAALLSELTQAVRRFGMEQQRVPKTLQEVATQGYLNQVPPAPTGKQYAISKNLQVYLADK